MTTVYSIDVEITAPVYDTEVSARVEDAITNLFPGADVTTSPGELIATTHTLDHFSECIHRQEILDTARSQFFANRQGDTFTFALKKQAAFEGVVNFAVDDSDELGTIHVRVHVTDPSVEAFVDHIAPPTQDGLPIDPDDS